jgi:hypothetical protein
MSPRSEMYRQRAAEAKNRATQASNPHVKTAFEEVARALENPARKTKGGVSDTLITWGKEGQSAPLRETSGRAGGSQEDQRGASPSLVSS